MINVKIMIKWFKVIILFKGLGPNSSRRMSVFSRSLQDLDLDYNLKSLNQKLPQTHAHPHINISKKPKG